MLVIKLAVFAVAVLCAPMETSNDADSPAASVQSAAKSIRVSWADPEISHESPKSAIADEDPSQTHSQTHSTNHVQPSLERIAELRHIPQVPDRAMEHPEAHFGIGAASMRTAGLHVMDRDGFYDRSQRESDRARTNGEEVACCYGACVGCAICTLCALPLVDTPHSEAPRTMFGDAFARSSVHAQRANKRVSESYHRRQTEDELACCGLGACIGCCCLFALADAPTSNARAVQAENSYRGERRRDDCDAACCLASLDVTTCCLVFSPFCFMRAQADKVEGAQNTCCSTTK